LPVPKGFIALRVAVATMAAQNERQRTLGGKNVETSSRENRTPPMGAPKATATPADSGEKYREPIDGSMSVFEPQKVNQKKLDDSPAQAALRISLLFASFVSYFTNTRETMFPMQEAMWTIGPSLPRFKPDATESVSPTAFVKSVHPPR